MSQHATDARLFAKEIAAYLEMAGVDKRVTPKVSALFSRLTKTAGGANRALVESAIGLTQPEKRAIEKLLAAKTKAQVTADYRVNPELLTGLKIHVGELLIDTSGQTAVTDLVRTLTA